MISPGRISQPPFGGLRVLWWVHALLGGLITWLAVLVVRSLLVVPACALGPVGRLLLIGVSVVGAALTVHALLTALHMRRLEAVTEAASSAVGFIAAVGVLMNVIALLLIIVETLPVFLLDPCIQM